MSKIVIECRHTQAVCTESPHPLTSGLVGLSVAISYSDEWDGLTKNVVFRGSGVEKVMLSVTDTTTVPWECLETSGSKLEIGVEGRNSGNTLVIPTCWAYIGKIVAGADDDAEETTPPTPTQVAQLQAADTAEATARAAADATKQDIISDLSTIRSGAALGATALQSVPSTYRTAAAQDVIDAELDDAIDEKSTVSVSATGTATDEVQYITIDGVEKKLAGGSSGGGTWGSITGDLEDQTDLQTALDAKLASSHASASDAHASLFAQKVNDAPSDGKMYVRKDGAWARLFDSLETWEDIQLVTRAGIAPDVLEIGQEFTVGDYSIPAVVMGFIADGVSGSLKIKDSNLTNGVIFQFKDSLYNLQFDSAEAFYYAESALAAGTYNFTISSAYSSWVAGTYQFTLANELPVGGQLGISGNAGTALTSLKVNAYASQTATSYTEQCAIASGSNGTALGTMDGTTLNHPQRISYGNNRLALSAVRQQLNSSAPAGSVWAPAHKWDRPPSWVSSQKGFLNGLPTTFTDYLAEITVSTYRNTVTDGGGLDTTDDKIFLPGRNEVYMTTEGADNGVAWAYYKDGSTSSVTHNAADAIRAKKSGSSAYYWWLRSPDVDTAGNVRSVSAAGANGSRNAYNSNGVAPAFVIA